MKKTAFFLLCIILAIGCNRQKYSHIDILHPQFNLTFDGLLKNGFIVIPEDVPIVAKQIGDTLISYQFDDKMTEKSRPIYMLSKFPINSINTDSIEDFFWKRSCFRICEYQNADSFEIFYVKHQFKRFIYRVSIDKKENSLSLCYDYPQID